MYRFIIITFVTCMAAFFIGFACAEKPQADEPVTEKSTQVDSFENESMTTSSSKEAYEAVLKSIKDIEKSPTARLDVEKAIKEIEGILNDFLEKYPGTPEALDATYQLGTLYGNTMQPAKAIKFLNEFLTKSDDADINKVAFAHYILAESHKNSGDYKSAKKHYMVVIDRYAAVNTRLLGMARMNLEDLDISRQLAIGNDPIPFEVTDLKGNPLSLEKYKGKVVLLDFWATWCVPCIQEMPNVKRIYKQYHKEGFEIVGISLDRQRSSLESYIKKNDLKWPQYFDGKFWNNDIAVKYKVRSIPATYLLDRKGKIRYKSVRGSALARAVEELVKE